MTTTKKKGYRLTRLIESTKMGLVKGFRNMAGIYWGLFTAFRWEGQAATIGRALRPSCGTGSELYLFFLFLLPFEFTKQGRLQGRQPLHTCTIWLRTEDGRGEC